MLKALVKVAAIKCQQQAVEAPGWFYLQDGLPGNPVDIYHPLAPRRCPMRLCSPVMGKGVGK